MRGTGCILFVRCLVTIIIVAAAAAAAVDVVAIIIVPPLPFVCAIFEIDDISVFFLKKWHCLHFVIIIADRVCDSWN